MASDQIVSTGLRMESFHRLRSIVRYWGPVWLYAALIFGGSSVSTPPEVIASVLKEISDKLLHLCEYGILGVLSYRACRHAAGPWVARHAVMTAVVGSALYGLTDEVHQLYVPFRQADPFDLIADMAGALLGAWIWRRLEQRALSRPLLRPGA
ncbi:MAG: hypothetical protein OJF47_004002 [Nitrospira sp.]|jgi:VanZ family protein|nr:MAG: hypothetical protein OJF47_004002 [Nitrospira sp.]